MPTVTDVFVRYRNDYLRQFGPGLLPSHRRTISHIVNCRTSTLGGSLYRCQSCGRAHYSYHSCGDRHCPRCGRDETEKWARSVCARIPRLPCFLLTFTVPHQLNGVIRSHQKDLYRLLFRAAAEALKTLAADPRHLGCELGMLAVLHTWGRDIGYHPHVHVLVPAGGLDKRGRWIPSRYRDFLVPVKALSPIFRAKFRDGLRALGMLDVLDPSLFTRDWVVHCEPAGQGPELIRYLARYIRLGPLPNNRVVAIRDHRVTFRYQRVGTKTWKRMTLPALSFMARYLQHVLPRGFARVRHYGFLHPRCSVKLALVRQQLGLPAPLPVADEPPAPMLCAHCNSPLVFIEQLRRSRAPP
jgi:hypothetical protein